MHSELVLTLLGHSIYTGGDCPLWPFAGYGPEVGQKNLDWASDWNVTMLIWINKIVLHVKYFGVMHLKYE